MSPPIFRCAIYTRKSSEEGLEQSFNSLDAQREACEAYIKSQSNEGWRLIPARYDDGGFSGGNLDRPGLQKLLDDIDQGRIDIVVVYKVDRLTRALSDFAKIVDRLDAAGASFVSITQAFNTTTSMGRLTLNVLLSFAQFEREVTGERIRDKIAQSKARGIWMGGNLPLGYDSKDRNLVVNEGEAEVVRGVFRRYLAIGSVHKLRDELEAGDVRSKGGAVLSRGALFHLLNNRVYRGQIVHKSQAHPGLHAAIVDAELFDQVQESLRANRVARSGPSKAAAAAPLTGRVFDQTGHPMSPSFSHGRGGAIYRYYVSTAKLTGGAVEADAIHRAPARMLEAFVFGRLKAMDRRVECESDAQQILVDRVQRVTLRSNSVRIEIKFPSDLVRDQVDRKAILARTPPGDETTFQGRVLHLTAPVRMRLRGGRTWIFAAKGRDPGAEPRIDPALVAALKRGHSALAELGAAPQSRPDDLTDARAPVTAHLSKICRLALMAPDIQQAILAGRQPPGFTVQRVLDADIPVCWTDQKRLFGFDEG